MSKFKRGTVTVCPDSLPEMRNRITRLTERNAGLEAECERLKDEREVTLQSSEALCELYFEIAVNAIGADEVRRIRDEQSPGFALKYRSRLKQRADTLQAQLDAVRDGISTMAKQETTNEVIDAGAEPGDVEYGYNALVRTARKLQQALNAPETA